MRVSIALSGSITTAAEAPPLATSRRRSIGRSRISKIRAAAAFERCSTLFTLLSRRNYSAITPRQVITVRNDAWSSVRATSTRYAANSRITPTTSSAIVSIVGVAYAS